MYVYAYALCLYVRVCACACVCDVKDMYACVFACMFVRLCIYLCCQCVSVSVCVYLFLHGFSLGLDILTPFLCDKEPLRCTAYQPLTFTLPLQHFLSSSFFLIPQQTFPLSSFAVSPWYNRHGWLGVKNQLSIYLSISVQWMTRHAWCVHSAPGNRTQMPQVSWDTWWLFLQPSYGGSKQIVIHGSNLQIWYKKSTEIFKKKHRIP